MYEATLAQRERVLGDMHPDTLASRNNLANACRGSGPSHPSARGHARQVRAGARRRPPRHPQSSQ
ncbi:tetratricopeptide repeat protein [Streptomyces sp. NPDC005283]|uniref:tetratricopeptide repeat protein n=1 Tax=Streptomyces sp. NPDC005283 TaxID=3156871 RepID=UPI003452EB6E